MADQLLCDAFYNMANVVRVDVTMDATDWNTLRHAEPHGGRCAHAFTGDRYDWFTATVDLSGSTSPVGGIHTFLKVGIRKRSYCGSFSTSKPALAFNFDKFNPSNEAAIEGLIGTKHLSLNNSRQDDSFVRQAVGYRAFQLAGLPFSRCNFAVVRVNGQLIGLYVNVEPPKKPHIEHNFGHTLGNLYELESGEDFNPATVSSHRASFEGFSDFESGLDFNVATQALAAGTLDVIDIAQFTRFFAMEALLRHWDGYNRGRNNTYVYNDLPAVPNPGVADVKFKFVPWGIDQILQRSHDFDLYNESVVSKHVLSDPRLRHQLDRQIIAYGASVFSLPTFDAQFQPLIDQMQTVLASNGADSALSHVASVRQQLLDVATTDWPSALPGVEIVGQRSKATPAAAVFDGQLHMVHLGSSSNDLWHSFSTDGDVWSTNQRIPEQRSKAAVALAVFGGALHMVHLGDSTNRIWHSMFDGTSWTTNVTIPNQKSKATPALAVFRDRLHMVHLGDSTNRIYHSVFDGSSWSENTIIAGQLSKASPALAAFGGVLHMVHSGDSTNRLWHSTFDGTSWSTNVPIPSQLSKAAPALATFGGRLHMVHLGNQSNAIWHSMNDGSGWTVNTKALRKTSPLTPALVGFRDVLETLYVGDSGHKLWQGWIAKLWRLRPPESVDPQPWVVG